MIVRCRNLILSVALFLVFGAAGCSSGDTTGEGGSDALDLDGQVVFPDTGAVPDTGAKPQDGGEVGPAPASDAMVDQHASEASPEPSPEASPEPLPEPQPEPQPEVVEEVAEETVGPDAQPGTKQTGEHCEEGYECQSDMCISGEYTSAHCALLCESDADCKGPDQLWNGLCSAVGGATFKFCIFWCGMMGGECPGDLVCDAAACR
jgi:hypothetical protein